MKKKIAILYGGPDKESEVSVKSAQNILENIDRNKYEVIEIFIDKDCKYKILDKIYSELDALNYIKNNNFYKVFPILHGEYGEGGILQEKLENLNIDFVGSGSLSSKNAINKDMSNSIFIKNDILIPGSKVINKENNSHDFDYPIILKPIKEGSSFDLYKIENKEEYENIIKYIFDKYDSMLLQDFVTGREFTCGVIEEQRFYFFKKVFALPPTEIILTNTKTFDFNAKYSVDGAQEITPANISNELTKKIQDLAIKCHKVLDCKDISRTDIILSEKNNLFVLETNTMPGMTKTSFVPAQAESTGISIGRLIEILIK